MVEAISTVGFGANKKLLAPYGANKKLLAPKKRTYKKDDFCKENLQDGSTEHTRSYLHRNRTYKMQDNFCNTINL